MPGTGDGRPPGRLIEWGHSIGLAAAEVVTRLTRDSIAALSGGDLFDVIGGRLVFAPEQPSRLIDRCELRKPGVLESDSIERIPIAAGTHIHAMRNSLLYSNRRTICERFVFASGCNGLMSAIGSSGTTTDGTWRIAVVMLRSHSAPAWTLTRPAGMADQVAGSPETSITCLAAQTLSATSTIAL